MVEMSEAFFDWLNDCPVQWFRGEVCDTQVTYTFMNDTTDKD